MLGHLSELCMGQKHTKISEDLSSSKNMVFKMLDDGMDLMLQQRGQKEVM
jgi:hypothetical protein